MRLFFVFIFFAFSILACESTDPTSEAPSAAIFLQQTKYQFQQPLALRENLLAERGFDQLDSLQWYQLGLKKTAPYDAKASYFILGKLSPINELFSTLILLEDHPDFSRSWLVTYNGLGQRIDHLLVFYQKQPTPIRTSSYLNQNQIEITLEGSLKKRYQLTEAGTFFLLRE